MKLFFLNLGAKEGMLAGKQTAKKGMVPFGSGFAKLVKWANTSQVKIAAGADAGLLTAGKAAALKGAQKGEVVSKIPRFKSALELVNKGEVKKEVDWPATLKVNSRRTETINGLAALIKEAAIKNGGGSGEGSLTPKDWTGKGDGKGDGKKKKGLDIGLGLIGAKAETAKAKVQTETVLTGKAAKAKGENKTDGVVLVKDGKTAKEAIPVKGDGAKKRAAAVPIQKDASEAVVKTVATSKPAQTAQQAQVGDGVSPTPVAGKGKGTAVNAPVLTGKIFSGAQVTEVTHGWTPIQKVGKGKTGVSSTSKNQPMIGNQKKAVLTATAQQAKKGDVPAAAQTTASTTATESLKEGVKSEAVITEKPVLENLEIKKSKKGVSKRAPHVVGKEAPAAKVAGQSQAQSPQTPVTERAVNRSEMASPEFELPDNPAEQARHQTFDLDEFLKTGMVTTHTGPANAAPVVETAAPVVGAAPTPAIQPMEGLKLDATGLPQPMFSQMQEGLQQAYILRPRSITVKLMPEELGEVKVKVTIENDQLQAKIQTENQRVTAIIKDHQHELEHRLREQGIEFERFDVKEESRQDGDKGRQSAQTGDDWREQRQGQEKQSGSDTGESQAEAANDQPTVEEPEIHPGVLPGGKAPLNITI